MHDIPLTGAQRSYLRGLGQRLGATLKVGRSGLTPELLSELEKLLRAHELVKLRLAAMDRDERAGWCERIAQQAQCVWVGSVGHTALFYRQNPDPAARTVSLPE